MAKSKLVDETTETTEGDERQYKSEAASRIAQAQLGVPKKRVNVIDHNGVTYSTLCDALVAHGLDKVKDWPAARNALKKEGTYTRTAATAEGVEYELTLTTADPVESTEEKESTAEE